MSSLLILILPFLLLVFIALTYDKTVTPAIKFFNTRFACFKTTSPDIQGEEPNVRKTYKLYDEAIFIALLGLSFFTCQFLTSDVPLFLSYPSLFLIIFFWTLLLFKVHKIEVLKNNVIRFWGIFRNINIDSSDEV